MMVKKDWGRVIAVSQLSTHNIMAFIQSHKQYTDKIMADCRTVGLGSQGITYRLHDGGFSDLMREIGVFLTYENSSSYQINPGIKTAFVGIYYTYRHSSIVVIRNVYEGRFSR